MIGSQDREAQDAETRDHVPMTVAKRSALKIVRVVKTDVVVTGGQMEVNVTGETEEKISDTKNHNHLAETAAEVLIEATRKISAIINHKISDASINDLI